VPDTSAQQGLTDPLTAITRNPFPCEFQIPPPPTGLLAISYDLVQVIHAPNTGTPEEVPYAKTRGCYSSANGGWYYDIPPDMGTPSQIIMCPCTCASFGAGNVDILFGCHQAVTNLF
jgi:hypothetical protein